jgi:hypothetical protein
VIARERGCAAGGAGTDQGTDAREHTEEVIASGPLVEVKRSRIKDKHNFLIKCDRFQGRYGQRCIRGGDQGVVVPGNREHNVTVAGVRDHDGTVAREEGAVKNHVNALAGRNHGLQTADPPRGAVRR